VTTTIEKVVDNTPIPTEQHTFCWFFLLLF